MSGFLFTSARAPFQERNLNMQAEGSLHRYPPLHLWESWPGLTHRTLRSAPAPKQHLGDDHGTGAGGEIGRTLEGPGTGGLEGQPCMRQLMLCSSRNLQLQCALPLRPRILPSVWLALTMQLKFLYLQFAAGFKIKPFQFKLYMYTRQG